MTSSQIELWFLLIVNVALFTLFICMAISNHNSNKKLKEELKEAQKKSK
jgi:hypothetical protein